MERYKVTDRVLDVLESTTLMPEDKFGGWMAVNTGTNAASVLGYELQPGEGINMLDTIPIGSVYGSPIKIDIQAGGRVRITRRQATIIKPEKIGNTDDEEEQERR